MDTVEIKVECAKIAKEITIALLKETYTTDRNYQTVSETTNETFNLIYENLYNLLKK